MTDPRMNKLADMLINYSCALKAGEKVLIEAIDVPHEFTRALIESAKGAGGNALVLLKSNVISRALMLGGSEASWKLTADVEELQMENVQCYIGARGTHNISELSDVPAAQQKIYESTVWNRVHR